MQHSNAPRIELDRARDAIEKMKAAQSLDEFEEHWKQFLHRIERAWNKAKAHYGRSPKFGNWSAPVERMRRNDPLLSYLCNARGAEEHAVNEITEREPGSVGIGLADGVGVQPDGSVLIEHLEIKSGPEGLHVRSSQPLKVVFTPAKTRMAPIKNRGRDYPVPTSHQGQAFDASDLPTIAGIALQFYSDTITKTEQFFVK
jgi:hypothetical protein